MLLRLSLVLSIFVMSVLNAFSQSVNTDILNTIISKGDTADAVILSEADSVSVIFGSDKIVLPHSSNTSTDAQALDIMAFLEADTISQLPPYDFSSLDFVTGSSPTTFDACSVLDVITGAFSTNNYYASGTWGTLRKTNYNAFNDYNYNLIVPPNSVITSQFGYREFNHRMHYGIDIAMPVGDTVKVVLPGVIRKISFEQKGYGLYIIIDHANNTETRYAHLSNVLVSEGQKVEINDPIAISGNTGNSTGPHLHFETRINGQPVNPAEIFSFQTSTVSPPSP